MTCVMFLNACLHRECQRLEKEKLDLNTQIHVLKQKVRSYEKKSNGDRILKNDSDVLFFTGLDFRAIFLKLHEFVVPFVKRCWKGLHQVSKTVKRQFTASPKKFGPSRKLSSNDELLLTLMQLRLGLLNRDLANRFQISPTLCSQIFNGWLTALSQTISSVIYWAPKEVVHETKPPRYNHLPGIRAIIDCSEVFIETPKDPLLQTLTWSDYKHHNTFKYLISVAPNSAITYISPAYGGRASDKSITLDCGFLDMCDQYDLIQADKGFNIGNECAARLLTLHVPPGKCGSAQMTTAAVNKTKHIANLRILVEQIIRRHKTYRIIKYEIPLSLAPSINKILIVCAALCNLKKPMYTT